MVKIPMFTTIIRQLMNFGWCEESIIDIFSRYFCIMKLLDIIIQTLTAFRFVFFSRLHGCYPGIQRLILKLLWYCLGCISTLCPRLTVQLLLNQTSCDLQLFLQRTSEVLQPLVSTVHSSLSLAERAFRKTHNSKWLRPLCFLHSFRKTVF